MSEDFDNTKREANISSLKMSQNKQREDQSSQVEVGEEGKPNFPYNNDQPMKDA